LDTENKDLKIIFAENLTTLRNEAKMTQLELGNAISYSDKAISKWERAEAIPDAYVLMSLAKIFGVTVDYLLRDHKGRVRAKKINYASVIMLAIIAIYTVFAIPYITVLLTTGISYWMFFIYATVVSLVVLTVFNSVWGITKLNILIVSALTASIIVMIYCIFLPWGNFWQILCLIPPAVLIVICCFRLRISKLSFIRRYTRKKDITTEK
jgi:transcriptional regulator with XRE-family HTH domain